MHSNALASNVTVSSGGSQVLSGGTAVDTTISSGGVQLVHSNALASNATVSSGGSQVLSGGIAADTIIAESGKQVVSSGGTATMTKVLDGGVQLLDSSGLTEGTTVSSGGSQVLSGGIASHTRIAESGKQVVFSGGTATVTEIANDATQIVNTSGLVTDTTINSGGSQVLSGGTAYNTIIAESGKQLVSSGGTAIDGTVLDGGAQTVSSGGVVAGVVQMSGGNINVTVLGNDPAVVSGTNAKGATVHMSGGTADNFILYSGGWQLVSSGGTTYHTEVNSGANQDVYSLGSTVETVINSGGMQNVYDGGTSFDAKVNTGGIQDVLSGGIALETEVNSGGSQIVQAGGTIVDTTVNTGGATIVNSGTIVVGTLSNTGIVYLTDFDGGRINALAGTGGLVDFNASGVPTYGQTINISNLSGSQTFDISADLKNNKADKLVLDNASGTHYIRVTKEASNSSEILGLKGVATIAQINGTDAATFKGIESTIEGVKLLPQIVCNGNLWQILSYRIIASELAKVAGAAAKLQYAAMYVGESNIQRRVGDLKDNLNNAGVWMRLYSGKATVDSSLMRYNVAEGGYDKVAKLANGYAISGISLEYLDASTNYQKSGNGSLSNTRVGVYYSWLGDSGHYYDLVAKTGRMSNHLNVYEDDGKVTASYGTWNTSISAEYGYKKQLKYGYYITPQAELIIGKINGANYRASNGTLVKQDSINSVISRLGITVGRKLDKSSLYMTGSILHEFVAKTRNKIGDGMFASTQGRDLKGTYFEFVIGGNLKIANRGMLYMEALKNFGGKVNHKWQLQAGYRINF